MNKYVDNMISIIIPCYNCALTLKNTVESIQSQTYKNYEIILVDDGSQDETWNVIKEIKKNNIVRIKILHQINKGVSFARNAGLLLSCGEYVVFIDADDLIAPKYLEYLITGQNLNNFDVSYCFFTRHQNCLSDTVVNQKSDYKSKTQNELIKKLINEKYRLGFTTFLFKHCIIDKFSLSFPAGLRTGEDLEFLWSYLIYCNTGVEINRYLYWYYDNPTSAVHKINWERTDSFNSIKRIKKKMDCAGCVFSNFFYEYMTSRYLWSYAKSFSVGKRKDLFDRLSEEFPVKDAMKYLISHCSDARVKVTSILYLIHKDIFYYIIGIVRR